MGVHSARGGQDCYLLMCEIRVGAGFCPIHRFDELDHILNSHCETGDLKPKTVRKRISISEKNVRVLRYRNANRSF